MESREARVSAAEARKLDMVEYLAGLDHKPAKIREADYWYLAPKRPPSRSTAS
jgi:hypothetical protein